MTPTPEPLALLTIRADDFAEAEALTRAKGWPCNDAKCETRTTRLVVEIEAQAAKVTRLRVVLDGHRAWLAAPNKFSRTDEQCEGLELALADLDQRLAPPKA